MATTYSYSGSLIMTLLGLVTFSGDTTGAQQTKTSVNVTFDPSTGDSPTISGYLAGSLSFSGSVDMLLADSTDPMQGAGNAAYSPGFTVASSKLKAIYIKNTSASASITVARGAAAGLPIFDAASDAITIPPSGIIYLQFNAGTAALSTTTNDKLTITSSSGTATGDLVVFYGP